MFSHKTTVTNKQKCFRLGHLCHFILLISHILIDCIKWNGNELGLHKSVAALVHTPSPSTFFSGSDLMSTFRFICFCCPLACGNITHYLVMFQNCIKMKVKIYILFTVIIFLIACFSFFFGFRIVFPKYFRGNENVTVTNVHKQVISTKVFKKSCVIFF